MYIIIFTIASGAKNYRGVESLQNITYLKTIHSLQFSYLFTIFFLLIILFLQIKTNAEIATFISKCPYINIVINQYCNFSHSKRKRMVKCVYVHSLCNFNFKLIPAGEFEK